MYIIKYNYCSLSTTDTAGCQKRHSSKQFFFNLWRLTENTWSFAVLFFLNLIFLNSRELYRNGIIFNIISYFFPMLDMLSTCKIFFSWNLLILEIDKCFQKICKILKWLPQKFKSSFSCGIPFLLYNELTFLSCAIFLIEFSFHDNMICTS